jgi:hypothetical protein
LAEAGQPDLNRAGIDEIQKQFQDPPADSRIMMRWWWFGPSATREELDAEMRRMKDGGIGGFEVATGTRWRWTILDRVSQLSISLQGVPRPDRVRFPESARARAADGPHDRQRLVFRRAVYNARARREPAAL